MTTTTAGQTGSDARIVLIGAGSTSFGLKTLGDLMTVGADPLAGATIVLHDLVEDNLRRTRGVMEMAMREAAEDGSPAPFTIESTLDLRAAVTDAQYVIMSIEHGNRMETWAQDYYVPRKHGSKQIYGENGGPGGAFHTWRQVPPMLAIAETMLDLCPDAWLINYSNPLPRVCWAINRATRGKLKTMGLCHGYLAGTVALGQILGTRIDNLAFTSAGLNHFYWLVEVAAKREITIPARGCHPERAVPAGTDLVPLVAERGITWATEREMPLIAELFRLYGYLTYPGQSHPGEYIPWADAYCPSVKYDFQGEARHARAVKEKLERTLAGEINNYWWVTYSTERAIPIVAAMEHDAGQRERAVNVTNDGAISNLPAGCVVEVPATVDKRGIHPQAVGAMPLGIAQLLQREVALQELVVDAALTGDYNMALQALATDATVPSPAVARAILDEMLELQRPLLPQFFAA